MFGKTENNKKLSQHCHLSFKGTAFAVPFVLLFCSKKYIFEKLAQAPSERGLRDSGGGVSACLH